MWKVLAFVLCFQLACFSATTKAKSDTAFVISDREYGSVRSKILQNTRTGESAEVLWNWGGKIEKLVLKGTKPDGVLRDVIATRCISGEECNATVLQNTTTRALGALLIPFANRIENGSYSFDGREEYFNHDNVTVSHGFLIDGLPMSILGQSTTNDNASLQLGYVFNGSEPGYPFVVKVVVTYTLGTLGQGLTVNIRATNLMGTTAAPFMVGCHPYFKLEHSTVMTARAVLDKCTSWNRQLQTLDQVPNGRTVPFTDFDGDHTLGAAHLLCPACKTPPHWDDGFTALATPHDCPLLKVLILDGDDTLWLELGDGFRYTQLFTGHPTWGVAVEPMSSETNSFNNEDGLIVLEAGGSWQGQFRLGMD
eukprot:m.89912 g.89912  ORF g.89912 m.89912 type:complete len:366 (-) comp26343_c0_seq1:315-1412(-)